MFQAGGTPALPGASPHAFGVRREALRYGHAGPVYTDEDRQR